MLGTRVMVAECGQIMLLTIHRAQQGDPAGCSCISKNFIVAVRVLAGLASLVIAKPLPSLCYYAISNE